MNDNTKITLTVKQLRQLVKECAPERIARHTKPILEAKGGADGKFHAQDLVAVGFELDKNVDAYNAEDKKSKFYRLDGSDAGAIYSRKGSETTLIPYNPETGKRGRPISGDYKELKRQLNSFINSVKALDEQ